MVEIENWSDQQIRTKLTELGYPIMPITGTTRKLMVKKLKLLLENNTNVKDGGGRKSLGNFSSEEESDQEVTRTTRDKNRRITMAVPTLSATTTSKRDKKPMSPKKITNDINPKINENIVTDVPTSRVSKSVITTTTSKVIKTIENDFDTGSDSEPEVIEIESSKSLNESSFNNKESVRSSISTSLPRFSSPILSSNVVTLASSRYINTPPENSRADLAYRNLQQIRSRLNLGVSANERPISTSSNELPLSASSPYQPPSSGLSEKPPYLSNFTKRLSMMSDPSLKQRYKNDAVGKYDTNDPGSYPRPSYRTELNRNYYAPQHKSNVFKENWISFTVLGIAFLFFVFVATMYYGIRSDENALETV